MIRPDDEIYLNREQSAVKQYVLSEYLLPFAIILGTFRDIAYIDCCAGPWGSRTDDFSDTSFSVAVRSLIEAKETLKGLGHFPQISCLFIEQDRQAFRKLQEFCKSVNELDAEALQGNFNQKVEEIKSFLSRKNNPFPFFFIDPTGWKPIRIAAIKPILELEPGEVLINFMTSHIRRFLSLESLDFDALLGPGNQAEIEKLHGSERDEAAVFAYASEVMKAGRFPYVSMTVVPNPLKAQAHFHLIYATRHWKGIEKFKEAEKRALKFAEQARSHAREWNTGQPSLDFGSGVNPREHYLHELRGRCLRLAEERVRSEIESGRANTYHTLRAIYLRRPLVWESDFRDLLKEWKGNGFIESNGNGDDARIRKS